MAVAHYYRLTAPGSLWGLREGTGAAQLIPSSQRDRERDEAEKTKEVEESDNGGGSEVKRREERD